MAINSLGSFPSFPVQRPTENSGNKSKMAFTQKLTAGKSVNAKVSKQASNSAKLSAAASQFANRRQSDKSAGNEWSSDFEHILEDNSAAKAHLLLKIATYDNLSLELLLRQARSLFPDDSDMVMVLNELLRQKTLKGKQKMLVEKALKDVKDKANPRDLKAGINSGLAARLFGESKLELKPMLLRASYRQFLDNEQHCVEDYQDWIACYGHNLRSDVLDFIEAALVADMSSGANNCSCIEFGPIMGKLGQLKLLRSGDEIFTKKIISNELINRIKLSEADWLLLYFSLLIQPEAIGEHLNILLGGTFRLFNPRERAMIIQVIFNSCKSLPHALFEHDESVNVLLSELKHLMSIAHRRELIEKRRNQ